MRKTCTVALCSETTEREICLMSQRLTNAKITKSVHAIRSYAHSYNIEILNFFNPEL